jgi:hypothetical protein
MTPLHPANGSSDPAQSVDTSSGSSDSCAPIRPARSVLDWDSAWGGHAGAYEAPEHAALEARDMFQRVLAPWAMDVLRLKAAWLERPTRPDRSLPALDALPLRPCAAPRRRAA